jgi:hypothetical protein
MTSTSSLYTTLIDARRQCGVLESTDEVDDARIESIIAAVSRHIDIWTGRRFHTSTADETRYFCAETDERVDAGDILAVTTLRTDYNGDRVYESTWSTSDYELEPSNAPYQSQPEPYTHIYATPTADYSFPAGLRRGVQVTGRWGYSTAAPDVVREACLIQVSRIFRRRDSPFGVAGTLDLGTIRLAAQLDPDVKAMLSPLRRITIA